MRLCFWAVWVKIATDIGKEVAQLSCYNHHVTMPKEVLSYMFLCKKAPRITSEILNTRNHGFLEVEMALQLPHVFSVLCLPM